MTKKTFDIYTAWTIISFICLGLTLVIIHPSDNAILSDIIGTIGGIIILNFLLWIIISLYKWSNEEKFYNTNDKDNGKH